MSYVATLLLAWTTCLTKGRALPLIAHSLHYILPPKPQCMSSSSSLAFPSYLKYRFHLQHKSHPLDHLSSTSHSTIYLPQPPSVLLFSLNIPSQPQPRNHEKPSLSGAWSRGSRICFKQSALCLAINTNPSDNTTPETSSHTVLSYVNHAICWKSRHGCCNFDCQSAEEEKIHQVQLGCHETKPWEKQKIPYGVDPDTYVQWEGGNLAF